MDGYVKFGLLLIAVITLLWVLLDGWYKKRYTRITDTALLNKKSIDSEFTMSDDSDELFDAPDQVGPSRVVSLENGPTQKTSFRLAQDQTARVPAPEAKRNPLSNKVTQPPSALERNLLVLCVMAKPSTHFVSYDLLQAISNAGMQLGAMNIFHYYQATISGKIKLFSLASANKPGDFDINNMGNFSCTGLMLFMNIAEVPDPQHTFKLMLETAEGLVEDLDGILHADPLTPWNEKVAWQYQKKLFNLKSR
ncbi:MAG: cell division protein ZipA [uncultured bacterium]|nr:MAG: cell division protein ZipA [uncultured bacterium]